MAQSTVLAQADAPQKIDINPGAAIERVDSWIDGAVRLLPNIVVAIVVFVIIWFVARLVKSLIFKQSSKRNRDNLGEVMGGS